MHRRNFLAGLASATIPFGLGAGRLAQYVDSLPEYGGDPGDESFWFQVQQSYATDRSIVNLENGGVNPSPLPVVESQKAHIDYSNKAPVYTMNRVLAPQLEAVRLQLAAAFGCKSSEIAFTRNTTEAMEILQLGLDLEPGDEVVTTTQDYWRFSNTWKQRAARDGIVFKTVQIPTPCENDDELVARFAAAMTTRTKVIMACHVINLTGQILPIAKLQRLADERGVDLLVDGAHGFGQFAFKRSDLGCRFYTCSLHKWLGAPHGTGFLYVNEADIPRIWPMFPAPENLAGDIRKFENIGTAPVAPHLAIADALRFYQAMGPDRKEEKLRHLTDLLRTGLADVPGLSFLTSADPRYSCALTTFSVEGVDHGRLADRLWQERRILVRPISHPEYVGIRVTPNVYNTPQEIEMLVEAVRKMV